MGKRVLFTVVEKGDNKIDKDTKESINANLGKEDSQVFLKFTDNDFQELYYVLKDEANKLINNVDNFDYVCLIPNGAILNAEAKSIFEDYQFDREDEVREIYLPLVFASLKDEKQSLLLNKHIWNSSIAYEAGVLDPSLAVKQIDSTIFGAFIPTDLFFDEKNYDPNVKYYQQYHLLTNMTDGDNLVLGIPKNLLSIKFNDFDFQRADVANGVKVTNFNAAREKWNNTKQKEISVEMLSAEGTNQA